MDISIRPYSPEDREAVVALPPRSWEPVHASLARALGETLHQARRGPARVTYAESGFTPLPIVHYFKDS